MQWKIYYGDGSTFSDRDGSPYDAPIVNVQVIAFALPTSPTGFGLIHGKDVYVWDDNLANWQGTDAPGMWDYLMTRRGPKMLLFGRTLRNEDFWATVSRAGKEGLK